MNISHPSEARDENLIFEYERLRRAAVSSGTAYGLAPGERLLLSDGLYHWAIGWKLSKPKAALTTYRNRSETALSAGTLEEPKSSVIDLIASMAINSIIQTRRLHHVH